MVFLHEGLGCVELWRDFPPRIWAATEYGALIYSRAGYGKSDPITIPRSVRFMHDEALITLPQILDTFRIEHAILVGHSDGGSIALINAGGMKDQRICGLVLIAPHVFVEEISLESIKLMADEYREGNLRQRLERYHGRNVDCAFHGWNDVWLNPDFRYWNIEEFLPEIHVPILLIQGDNDQYGTLNQVEAIAKGSAGSVRRLILKECGHSPHLEQTPAVVTAIIDFVRDLSIEGTGSI